MAMDLLHNLGEKANEEIELRNFCNLSSKIQIVNNKIRLLSSLSCVTVILIMFGRIRSTLFIITMHEYSFHHLMNYKVCAMINQSKSIVLVLVHSHTSSSATYNVNKINNPTKKRLMTRNK